MKRFTSILLIITVIASVFVVGNVSTSAASTSDSIAVTQASMGKNGSVLVKWKALSYCKYYRVFYKIDNAGWIKAADVHYLAQGSYYPGQTMSKTITVPLKQIHSGRVNDTVRIYVTVRGMNKDKRYNTSFRPYLVSASSLQSFAPRMYMTSFVSGKATFTIGDPQNVNNSTKFRVFYKRGNDWKPIGDYYKNNLGNGVSVVTLNVPLYRVNGMAQFTARGINSKGQYSTPFLNDAVIENSPDLFTYRRYKIAAG